MPALENVEAYAKAVHRQHVARYRGGYDHEEGENNKEIVELFEKILWYLSGEISETAMVELIKETNKYAVQEEQDNIDNPYDLPEEDEI